MPLEAETPTFTKRYINPTFDKISKLRSKISPPGGGAGVIAKDDEKREEFVLRPTTAAEVARDQGIAEHGGGRSGQDPCLRPENGCCDPG